MSKVKTTQPRRYLVRPNQGVIPAGGKETVQILLVEKDKNALWQSYERLGASALQSKDKFLVQSCAVSQEFAQKYDPNGSGYQALSTMWAQVGSSNKTVSNAKLHVQHIVKNGSSPTAVASPTQNPPPNTSHMTNEQLINEVATVRRKYDELVAFSVNLTAERDILNNTLEQTKRDLNRELLKSNAGDNANAVGARPARGKASASGSGKFTLFLVAFFFLVVGIKLEEMGKADVFRKIPVVKGVLGNQASAIEGINDEF